jgi:hypothetical protein
VPGAIMIVVPGVAEPTAFCSWLTDDTWMTTPLDGGGSGGAES